MKKVFFFLLVTFLVIFFLVPQKVFAQNNFRQNNNVILPKGETIDKDYFAAGSTNILSGTVNGDAFLAGGNVVVDGTVNGDLLAAGGNIDVRGNVTGNVRVVGGQINLSSQVGKNLSMAAGNVFLANSAVVNGSLSGTGGAVSILGVVKKDLNLAAGQVTVGNQISGDANLASNQITLTPDAKITGNLNYWSSQQANLQNGSQVLGQVKQNQPVKASEVRVERIGQALARLTLTLTLATLLSYLLVGLLLLRFFPFFTETNAQTLEQKPWASLGLGLLITFLTPFLFIFLLLTVIGVPLAFLLIATFLVTVYLSKIIVSLMVGKILLGFFGRGEYNSWALLLGLLIYGILLFIPIVNGLVFLLVVFFGLGTLFLSGIDRYRQLRTKNLA